MTPYVDPQLSFFWHAWETCLGNTLGRQLGDSGRQRETAGDSGRQRETAGDSGRQRETATPTPGRHRKIRASTLPYYPVRTLFSFG